MPWLGSKESPTGLAGPKDLGLEFKKTKQKSLGKTYGLVTPVLHESGKQIVWFCLFACFQKVFLRFYFLQGNVIILQLCFLFVHLSCYFNVNF